MENSARNIFIPFPRYENAIFIGDAAVQTLAVLKIYAKCLIGGELPNAEDYYPHEKLLECTACMIRDKRRLKTAARRAEVDYILLGDNGWEKQTLLSVKEELEKSGFKILILDVSQGPLEAFKNAGSLFGEEKRAQRAIREYKARLESVNAQLPLARKKGLVFLTIRHPVDDRIFTFALSDAAEIYDGILKPMNIEMLVLEKDFDTVMPGLVEVTHPEEFIALNPDFIAFCGDYPAGMLTINSASKKMKASRIPAIENQCIYPLPYYCHALSCRRPRIMQLWLHALTG